VSARIRALALAAAALLLAPFPYATAAAAAPGCRGGGVPLRLVAGAGSTVLTGSVERARQAETRPGFTDRGIVALAGRAAGPGSVGLTRYRLGDDYVYAGDATARTAAERAGYRTDGETLYASATPAPGCTLVVYQLQRGKNHQLAVGGAAVDALVHAGWAVQGPVLRAADAPGRTRAVPTGAVAQPLPAEDGDPTFGLAVLPDTQEEVHTDTDFRLRQRSEYVAAHQKSWDLRLAVSVGDIADWDTPDHAQYARAADQLRPLMQAVPFVAVPGNHDTAAVCPGGSACAGLRARTTVRDTTVFNTYFPASRFSLLRGEYEPGKVDNAYHTFRAGNVDWLVINLELWPRQDVVAWAAGVVAANPTKNVIVVTHSYLTKRGKILGNNGGYGSTSPKYLADHLIKRYPNVKIVLSGHTGKDKMRIDRGQHGNRIVSYLQCFHSRTDNPLRLLTIHTDTGKIDSAIYTPSKDRKVTTTTAKRLTFVN
jgi:calcineurin-like phosphoesterase family protein